MSRTQAMVLWALTILLIPLIVWAQDSTPMPDPVELAAKIGAVCAFVGFGLKAWPSISDEWSKQIIAVVGILAYVGLVHGWGDLDAWIGGIITSMAANGIVTTAAGVKRIASGEKVALVPKDQV